MSRHRFINFRSSIHIFIPQIKLFRSILNGMRVISDATLFPCVSAVYELLFFLHSVGRAVTWCDFLLWIYLSLFFVLSWAKTINFSFKVSSIRWLNLWHRIKLYQIIYFYYLLNMISLRGEKKKMPLCVAHNEIDFSTIFFFCECVTVSLTL